MKVGTQRHSDLASVAASSRITDGNVIFAVGMRRIVNGSGPIMRIRRVSDNAEINLITGDPTG